MSAEHEASQPDGELVFTLSELALRIQRTRGAQAALRLASEGLEKLGYTVVVGRTQASSFRIEHISGLNNAQPLLARCFTIGAQNKNARRLSDGPVSKALKAGRAILVEDILHSTLNYLSQTVPELKSEQLLDVGPVPAVIAPLLVGGQPWGVLVVGAGRLRPGDLPAWNLFAAHLAAALEVSEAIEDLERRRLELSVLKDLGEQITRHLDLPAVLSTAVAQAARVIDAANAFVLLLDETKSRLVLAGSVIQDGSKPSNLVIPMSQSSAATEAVRTMTPVCIQDVENDPRAAKIIAGRFSHKSLLGVPLAFRGEPIGALVLGEVRAERRFTQREVDLAMAVANQLAAAIAHAKAYDELKTGYAQLEKAQAEVVRHERLAALGELGAVMAHEVRNPLGVIFNSLPTLRRLVQHNSDAQALLAIVQEEADRLDRIVSDLLDFARPYEPELALTELEPLLSSAVEAASAGGAGGNSVHVALQLSAPTPAFPLDARLVRQALVNLIINAAQAMPGGGEVRVRALVEELEDRRVARIEVADQGTGITPENLGRVFQPFFTTKAKGTGLGLAVVKRIVEAHQGELLVHSRPGEGAVFSMLLPEGRFKQM